MEPADLCTEVRRAGDVWDSGEVGRISREVARFSGEVGRFSLGAREVARPPGEDRLAGSSSQQPPLASVGKIREILLQYVCSSTGDCREARCWDLSYLPSTIVETTEEEELQPANEERSWKVPSPFTSYQERRRHLSQLPSQTLWNRTAATTLTDPPPVYNSSCGEISQLSPQLEQKKSPIALRSPPPVARRSSSLGLKWKKKILKPMAPVEENGVLSPLVRKPFTASRSISRTDISHTNTANQLDSSTRAASEFSPRMSTIQVQSRASSLGPIFQRKHSFTDNGIYECNYESIDGYSSSKSDDSSCAILQLENAVKSLDKVLEKDSKAFKYENKNDFHHKVQYDSITVLPTTLHWDLPSSPTHQHRDLPSLPNHQHRDLPPPPLPRTRSFRDKKGEQPRSTPSLGIGRASSAPPISPLFYRRFIQSVR